MRSYALGLGVLALFVQASRCEAQEGEPYFPDFQRATWTYASPSGRQLTVQANLVSGPGGERISEFTLSFVAPGGYGEERKAVFYFAGSGTAVISRRLLNLNALYDRARIVQGRQVRSEYEWFRFNAKPGESWEALGNDPWTPQELGIFTMTLVSDTAQIQAAGRLQKKCLQIRLTQTNGSQVSWDQYFARGVGMVRLVERSRPTDPFDLKSFTSAR